MSWESWRGSTGGMRRVERWERRGERKVGRGWRGEVKSITWSEEEGKIDEEERERERDCWSGRGMEERKM